MTEIFPGPSLFGPVGPPDSVIEEGRRAHALELAAELHVARTPVGHTLVSRELADSEVIDTAKRFAAYLRDGE